MLAPFLRYIWPTLQGDTIRINSLSSRRDALKNSPWMTKVGAVTAFFPEKHDSPEKFKSFVSAIETQFAAASI